MKFDFPIEKIEYAFDLVGDCAVEVTINGRSVLGNVIHGHLLKGHNTLRIKFTKEDPSDTKSFATLKYFKINDGDFTDEVKLLEYDIDRSKHHDAVGKIRNNLYFGYIGSMEVLLEQSNDLLKKAAWLIASEEFENPKENTRGNPYREKNFNSIHEDSKYMFAGCLPPKDRTVMDVVDSFRIKDIKQLLDFKKVRSTLEEWIGNSNILKFKNLDQFESFNYGSGVVTFLDSFINRCKDNVYVAPKHYYFIGEVIKDIDLELKNAFEDIEEHQRVLFEYPSPWYDNKTIIRKIKEARSKNCYIGLDLTWAPVSTDVVDIDLSLVDEVYFSMNKAWPIHDLRPAWRWSKKDISDATDFQQRWGYYQKLQPNIFLKLIEKFEVDHTYNRYKDEAESICKKFELDKTNILWFTRHKAYKHDVRSHTSKHYFLDDFVCIRKLLDFKNKYWW
jgi:hypothetical protein